MERVLVVGAGAIGQVYGRWLVQAGYALHYFVRPAHRAAVERGLAVRTVSIRGDVHEEPLAISGVYSAVDEVPEGPWAAVWLCIPSSGLMDAALEALLHRLRGTMVVSLTPALEDRQRLRTMVDASQLVAHMIPLAAWGDSRGRRDDQWPATCVFVPPLTRLAFEGERADDVVTTLKRAGIPARVDPNIMRTSSFASAVLIPFVATLETVHWQFEGLTGDTWAGFRQSVKEATRAVSHRFGKPPVPLRWAPYLLASWMPKLGQRLAPFPLDAFLKQHFMKVGEQTTLMLLEYQEAAREGGCHETPALDAMIDQRLRKRRASL